MTQGSYSLLQGWASVSPHPPLFPLCVVMTLKSQFFSSQISVSLHILYNGAHLMKWKLNNLRNILGQTQSTVLWHFVVFDYSNNKKCICALLFLMFFKKHKLIQLIKCWWGMRMVEVNGANFFMICNQTCESYNFMKAHTNCALFKELFKLSSIHSICGIKLITTRTTKQLYNRV